MNTKAQFQPGEGPAGFKAEWERRDRGLNIQERVPDGLPAIPTRREPGATRRIMSAERNRWDRLGLIIAGLVIPRPVAPSFRPVGLFLLKSRPAVKKKPAVCRLPGRQYRPTVIVSDSFSKTPKK
jgi:hypothetical protein